jgi:hypothetical protein
MHRFGPPMAAKSLQLWLWQPHAADAVGAFRIVPDGPSEARLEGFSEGLGYPTQRPDRS